MSVFIQYFLKLSISLAVVYLFYQLVLRRLTFYNWNRWYLLGYTMLSFFIPFINISPVLRENEWSESGVVLWIPAVSNYSVQETSSAFNFFTLQNILLALFLSGVIIMLVRLLIQFISFRRMMRKAELVSAEDMKIYQVNEPIIPFSFGKSIFINRNLHSAVELEEIIRHEFVHVRQRHSIDIIWAEILCMLNWYNPFAWLLRASIRQNLEFVADNNVLQNGIDKKQYQYLLLKVVGNNQFSIASKFNFSSLKKRIVMMNKIKSARVHLLRFLFVLPLLAVILVSFREQIGDSLSRTKPGSITQSYTDTIPKKRTPNSKGYIINVHTINDESVIVVKDTKGNKVATIPGKEWRSRIGYYEDLYGRIPPPAPLTQHGPPTAPGISDEWVEDFVKLNPGIDKIGRVYDNKVDNRVVMIHIFRKDGTKEEYELWDAEDVSKLKKKYKGFPGEAIMPAPPKPPAPPSAPDAPAPPAPPAHELITTVTGSFNIEANNPDKPFANCQTVAFVTDNLQWINKNGGLQISGDLVEENGNINVTLSGTFQNLNMEIAPYLVINGREAQFSQDITANKGQKYRIVVLGKDEATKKYGEKGVNGALEVMTMDAVSPFKNSPDRSFFFEPFKKQKPNPNDGC